MLTIPIPLVVTLILGFLAVRHAVLRDRSILFLVLLSACALQALLVSLTQHYGVTELLRVQPVTAAAVPPLAWLMFQSANLRPLDMPRDVLHAASPAFVVFCIVFAPATLDVVLSSLFAGYGLAIFWHLRAEKGLPLARLSAGPLPGRVWTGIGILLTLSALADLLIAGALAMGRTELRPLIISIFNSFTLLGIGLLGLSREAEGAKDDDTGAPPGMRSDATPTEEDTALVARLDRLMTDDRLYLDPDLTLARLARRLHVPVKQLSAAINRKTGENVSRYVNGHRVRHAAEALGQGESVTTAMLASGFNTKSNFNREFARVMGASPTDWRAGGERT